MKIRPIVVADIDALRIAGAVADGADLPLTAAQHDGGGAGDGAGNVNRHGDGLIIDRCADHALQDVEHIERAGFVGVDV